MLVNRGNGTPRVSNCGVIYRISESPQRRRWNVGTGLFMILCNTICIDTHEHMGKLQFKLAAGLILFTELSPDSIPLALTHPSDLFNYKNDLPLSSPLLTSPHL